ncbi:hypothetical protein GCM10009687_47700 [Asanoa iriomotensis]
MAAEDPLSNTIVAIAAPAAMRGRRAKVNDTISPLMWLVRMVTVVRIAGRHNR